MVLLKVTSDVQVSLKFSFSVLVRLERSQIGVSFVGVQDEAFRRRLSKIDDHITTKTLELYGLAGQHEIAGDGVSGLPKMV